MFHSPAAQDNRRKGGRGRKTSARAEKLLPARLRPVIEELETAFYDACGDTLTSKTAKFIAPLARAIVTVYQAGVQEEALRDMQAQIAELQRQQGMPAGPTRWKPA